MLTFTLNGRPQRLEAVPAQTTALSLLRDRLGHCGTKEGCASGDCGACTVALGVRDGDGWHYHSTNACITPAHQLEGHHVLTVEGLANESTLHPVQQAMVDWHASQCGFCTPGIVMSLFCLYQQRAPGSATSPPDDDTIEAALSGNLCRCTGYRSIRDAARAMHTLPPVAIAPPSEESATPPEEHATPVNDAEEGFHRPHSRAALVATLTRFPRARLVAGGTDLMLEHTLDLKPMPALIDLSGVTELGRIEAQADGWWIGAGVSYSRLEPLLAETHPAFHALLTRLGSRQIRNRATLAGNLANASPIGDTPPVLMALGARLRIDGQHGPRELGIDHFFTGYRTTALAPGEYLDAVYLPRLGTNERLLAWKLSKRGEDDIAAVTLALRASPDAEGRLSDVRVACGGMAATPQRAPHVEAALTGQRFDAVTLARAQAALAEDFSPIDDVRASAAYRLAAAGGLLARAHHHLTPSRETIPTTLEEV